MKVFVFEYITSGALCEEQLPASLAREGENMLRAIVNDLAQLPGIELRLLRDHRLDDFNSLNLDADYHCQPIHSTNEFEHYYTATLDTADAVFIIAPETGGILNKLQQSVLVSDTLLLGCQPSASEICGDKIQCYQALCQHNIATVKTILASDWQATPFISDTGYILKPRDGAGCVDTLFFADHHVLAKGIAQSSSLNNFIIQPYISGLNLSLNLLYSDDDVLLLSINQQHIQHDNGQFHLSACTVNGADAAQLSRSTALALAQQLKPAITGLWGFVGVDIIVANDTLFVIDINPRLTSAYIGLHRSLSINPCALLFSMNTSDFHQNTLLQHQPIEVLL